MKCEAVRDALLQADEAVLRGSGDDALAEHLRGCARCGRVAAKLLDKQQELAATLGLGAAAAPPGFVDRVLERAVVRPAGFADGVTQAAADVPREPAAQREQGASRAWDVLRGRARRVAVPALAAAAVAALLLWPEPGPPAPASFSPAAPTGPLEPRIEPAPGRSVAVMKTGNPSITVVWLLEGGER